jgi:hypothetical protein
MSHFRAERYLTMPGRNADSTIQCRRCIREFGGGGYFPTAFPGPDDIAEAKRATNAERIESGLEKNRASNGGPKYDGPVMVNRAEVAAFSRKIEALNGHAYTPEMEAALLPERRPGE